MSKPSIINGYLPDKTSQGGEKANYQFTNLADRVNFNV